ncbi:metallophosphoesterase [bacterium]|nr:metallophosphoesterase [bacterium]MBU1072948.1 metallophosphoesterase [bacterium]MBU1675620.1 metallophosphoesterase [bacterium]
MRESTARAFMFTGIGISTMVIRILVILALVPIVLVISGIPGRAAEPIDVHCLVYLDENEDGQHQPQEPGLPGVRVTNGVDVLSTDAMGSVDLQVDPDDYRFVTMTISSGYWPTDAWYHRLDSTTSRADTVRFGLRPAPELSGNSFRWIHIADTQINSLMYYPLAADIQAMNRLELPPVFIVNTGDIVNDGHVRAEWEYYLDQMSVSEIPVFNVVGNHDDDSNELSLALYEEYVGPPYYSFDIGDWHFITFNTWRRYIHTPSQAEWLDRDAAQAPPGSRLVVFEHFSLRYGFPEVLQQFVDLGIQAVFSGHHHFINLSTHPAGIGDYSMVWPRGGGRDWTPRSYSLVSCHEDGSIDFEIKRLLIDHRTILTSPASEDATCGPEVPILVQAYDSAAAPVDLTAHMYDPSGIPLEVVPLSREGISLWRGAFSTDGWPTGEYRIEVHGNFDGVITESCG